MPQYAQQRVSRRRPPAPHRTDTAAQITRALHAQGSPANAELWQSLLELSDQGRTRALSLTGFVIAVAEALRKQEGQPARPHAVDRLAAMFRGHGGGDG